MTPPRTTAAKRKPAKPAMLTLDQFRNAPGVPEEIVPIPEWGGAVKVRGLTQGAIEAVLEESGGDDALYHDLVWVNCIAEPAGLTIEDARRIRDEAGLGVWNAITEAISRVNGDGEAAVEDATRSFPAGD